ncbi:hypothetical protein TNCV_4072731 [Trichonephila clavipes]|uniref:Uncharacterized protein n=1 Tax=Trichonephila clavipes TaxID=2585209 RepID=A0A8X6W7Z3_TRICX|nr:hypothetical protein TNCV_4072731 [Trichonephila clavipes]
MPEEDFWRRPGPTQGCRAIEEDEECLKSLISDKTEAGSSENTVEQWIAQTPNRSLSERPSSQVWRDPFDTEYNVQSHQPPSEVASVSSRAIFNRLHEGWLGAQHFQ